MKYFKLFIIIKLALFFFACSKNQEALLKPESTKINGNISELVEIVDGEYKISTFPESVYATWQIQVKLIKLKDAHDFNMDDTPPFIELHLTNENGLPITNFKAFDFENGEEWDNKEKFLNFLNDTKGAEAWFTFYSESKPDELPVDLAKFNLRIDVKNAEYILNDINVKSTSHQVETIRGSVIRTFDYKEVFNMTNDFYSVSGTPYNIKSTSNMSPKGKISYSPNNVFDFNVNTGWSPDDSKGNGVGEQIEATITPSSHNLVLDGLIIFHGYFKGDGDLYEANSRVKKLKLYYDNKPHAILEFEDFNYPQSFYFSEPIELPGGFFENKFKFEILDVYSGNKYDDLVISEILFSGNEGMFPDYSDAADDYSEDNNFSNSSTNCEEALKEYESFIDDYIEFAERASSGDYSVMQQAASLMQKAERAGNKIQNMGQVKLGSSCWDRYIRMQQKLANAALRMTKNLPKNMKNMKEQMKNLENLLPD
jgi:hypothetical protein